MTSLVEPARIESAAPGKGGLWRRFLRVFARPKQDTPQLDPRALSDHLKRDLGFLDGRGG